MIELADNQTEFIERAGQILATDGMPRIGAEVLALLVVVPVPLTADEISTALRVSRAAVGTNVRLLESSGIVTRTVKLGDRCVAYTITDDPFGRVIDGMASRMGELASAAAEAGEAIDEPVARRRLRRMDHFFRLARTNAENFLGQWREQ